MSSVAGKFKDPYLVEGATADGDYPSQLYTTLDGDHVIGIYGTFDTATLAFVFFNERPDGTFVEMPISTDFTFTSAPDAQRFSFPKNMPFVVRVSSVGATTDLSVNVYQVS